MKRKGKRTLEDYLIERIEEFGYPLEIEVRALEREEIKRFLKNRKSTNLLKVVKFRAMRHIERLREDLEILEKLVGQW